MKSYQLIHQLIHFVEQLEEENPEQEVSMQEFAGFLLNKVADSTTQVVKRESRFGNNDPISVERAHQLENNIGRLFVFMSRYAKSYVKKALDGTPLQTAEDFSALAILLTHKHLSKSELISYNLQEKTSGTEVIRRLINAGLVKEWDDLKDRRSKNIAITDVGKDLLHHVFLDINHVGKMISGRLTTAEKLTLQYLLQKLENFHLELYENKTILTKADLRNFAETQLQTT